MKIKRHLYHWEGLTDLSAQRGAAQRSSEPAVLHLHSYQEEYDGCRWHNDDGVYPPSDHETYGTKEKD